MEAGSNEQVWNWPEPLDALKAAPQYYPLLCESESVHVLDARIPPGHTVSVHTHRRPSVLYVCHTAGLKPRLTVPNEDQNEKQMACRF